MHNFDDQTTCSTTIPASTILGTSDAVAHDGP